MKRIILLFLFIAVILTTGYLITTQREKADKTQDKTALYPTTEIIVGKKNFTVELAITDQQKRQGLSNRQFLPENQGMLFVFKPAEQVSFWMKDMEFPIDIIWIKDGRIIGFEQNVPAPAPNQKISDLKNYSPSEPVDYVLEINANASKDFKINDPIVIKDSIAV